MVRSKISTPSDSQARSGIQAVPSWGPSGTTRHASGRTTRMSLHRPLPHGDWTDRRKRLVLRPGGQGVAVVVPPTPSPTHHEVPGSRTYYGLHETMPSGREQPVTVTAGRERKSALGLVAQPAASPIFQAGDVAVVNRGPYVSNKGLQDLYSPCARLEELEKARRAI
jgi:hypothetical protein